MFRIVVTAVLASLALSSHAADGVELSLKTKALASAGSAPKADAPFAAGRDPLPQLLLTEELENRGGTRSGCEYTAKDVCYDLAERRVVYRPARAYMPKFNGLTPESVSFRSNRIVLKYSF